MGDFLKEALHAPLGTLFVLTGLAFVGIAIVGKVSGRIEPGKEGRIAGGLVGAILLIVGVVMHVQEAKTHSAPNSQDQSTSTTTDTHSDKQGKNQSPKVYTQGNIVIRGTWSCDLDVGTQTLGRADFFWEQSTAVARYLVPKNGAKFNVMGQREFRSVSYSDLTKLDYSEERIDGSDALYNRIPRGTVVGAITKDGRHSKFVITDYGYNLGISWVTYDK